jgi:putative transposase
MEVIDALEQARRQYGLPITIRVDQGSQFTSKELDLWAYANGVTLDFSRPGKPTDNAYAESFNATVRLECLGRHWFLDPNCRPFATFCAKPPATAVQPQWVLAV